ncbi:MAG: hypothetical protein ACOYKQ_12560 [Polymorphobacter sp.]
MGPDPSIAGAVLAVLPAPAQAVPMVVRAVGPSSVTYKPGQKLSETATLILKPGDTLTVLDAKGTRSFTGPGSFRFDQASASAAAPNAFAELLTQKSERRARIGAVRGSGGEMPGKPVPPGIWAIDAAAGGTVCAVDANKLSVWRAEPMAAGSMTITRVADGKSAALPFVAGQAIANWPAAVAGSDGAFRVANGTGTPTMLTIKLLAKAPTAIDELGAALLETGCAAQFERLANSTKAPAPAP